MNQKDYACRMYIIKEGDTLYSISRFFGIPLILILKVNPYVDIYNLQIGDEICIPTINTIPVKDMDEYIIRDGDTLETVLTRFGIDVNEFLKLNNSDVMQLRSGTVIKIPKLEP